MFDHLITNSGSNVTNSGILVSDVSDHLPIFASIKLSNSKTNHFQNTFRRSFSDKKEEKFIECLKKNLEIIDFTESANSCFEKFLLAFKNTIDEICPLRKVSRKQTQLLLKPWIENDIYQK